MSVESDEIDFGTTKDHGVENVAVHHVLTDLRATVERNFLQRDIMKARGGRAGLKTPRPVVVYKTNPR